MAYETLNVKVKKIHPDAVIPQYAHEGDAGVDLHSVENYIVGINQRVLVKTGLQMAIPNGYEAQVRPRSGLALKEGLTVLNTPGTVDAPYRGEIGVIIMNHGSKDYTIQKGSRIAQLVFKKVERAKLEEVVELEDTSRGAGGFGSTGVESLTSKPSN